MGGHWQCKDIHYEHVIYFLLKYNDFASTLWLFDNFGVSTSYQAW
jgi:hypothetical protein